MLEIQKFLANANNIKPGVGDQSGFGIMNTPYPIFAE